MDNKRILINGGGIAGLTLGYWLRKFGFESEIIEKRPDLRERGYMIDFYGSGFDVAEKMNLLGPLRERHYPVKKLVLVDSQGRKQSAFDIDAFRRLLHYRHFNFTRGDLEDVLYAQIAGQIPVRFGTCITQIDPSQDQVTVTLSDGTRREVDLLIGADGAHSLVRDLLWGNEGKFTRFLGYYVACSVIEDFIGDADTFLSSIQPKRQASVYPIRENQLATFFIYKSKEIRLQSRQEKLEQLNYVFGEMGWIIPLVLQKMEAAPELYFDSVSQIELNTWYQGRVAMVGDACQCLTLLAGQGASLAMAGAYLLAEELYQAEGDYRVAYPTYQQKMKPEIDSRQRQARKLAKSFVPDNGFQIWLTNLVLKGMFLPGLRSLFLKRVGAKSIIK